LPLLLFFAFLPAGPLPAQSPPVATQTPAPSELAIPVPEIATKAADLNTQLRVLDESLAPEPEIRTIEEKLPETIQGIVRSTTETQRLSQGQPTRDALAALETSWGSILKRLDGWKATLTRRATTLEGELQRLSQDQVRWEQTRQLARQSQAPEAVLDRVRETVTAIESTRHNVERRRKQILTLLDSVIAAQVQAQAALDQVRATQKELVGRILVPDSLPLWARIQAARRETGLATSITASVKANQAAVIEFLRTHRIRFIGHVLLIAVIALMLFRARGRVAELVKEEPKLIAMSRIYERPISAALLLGLWVTPWLYPTVPRPVIHLVGLLALVPAIRLLRRLVPPALVPGLYSLAGFYLVDRVRALISGAFLTEQAIFLIEMGAAIALSRWLLAPARIEQVRQQTDVQQLHLLTRAAKALTILFTGAAIASILGYTELGRLLGEGGLGSIYAGMILLASLEAIDGILIYVIRSKVFRQLRLVRHHGWLIRQHLRRLSRWLAFAGWLALTLRFFALLQPVTNLIAAIFEAKFQHGNVSLSLGDVLAFCVTIWLSFVLSRFLRFVLEEDVYPRVRLAHGMPYALSTLSRYVIVSLGFLFAMAAIGLDLTRVTILAGALGVGIGFGLQAIVNNFVSGLILLFERPIQVGDAIQIGDLLGEVKHIGVRASTVRTWDGAEVIVPNGDFISNQVRNWTLSDRLRRLEIPVGVAYGTEPKQVLALLTEVAAKHPAVLEEPPPRAFFIRFGDSSLDFELRAWTDRADEWFTVRSELAVAIHAALRDAHIEIPFPQRDVRLRSCDEDLRDQSRHEDPTRRGGATS
jgi:potassium-dependent mechanosensitive channel